MHEQAGKDGVMEILHKAKRKDNGEWVEGFYCQLPKISFGATIIANGEMCAEDVIDYIIEIKDKQHSNFSNGFPLEVVESEIYEVDSETVCVYIGKDDIEGKKIFNNDRIQFDDMGEEGYEYKEGYDFTNEATVVWNNGRFELTEFLDTNSGVLDEMNGCHEDFMLVFENCRVVGNRLDNKELLEVE